MSETQRILFRARVKEQFARPAPKPRDSPCMLTSMVLDLAGSPLTSMPSDDDSDAEVFFGPITLSEQCARRINACAPAPVGLHFACSFSH